MDSELLEAIRAGKRADALRALAIGLGQEFDKSPAPFVAKELREVLKELDSLGVAEGDDVDDLAAQRAKRRSGASA